MAAAAIPTLRDGDVTLRPIRARDAKVLERVLARQPRLAAPVGGHVPRRRLGHRHAGEHPQPARPRPQRRTRCRSSSRSTAQLVGQLNVSSIAYGSLSSATIGYWVSQAVAGRGITPTAVALATDYCFSALRLHRMEICIRPENQPSLRVVEKLGFRYEGLRRRFIHINGDWRDHFAFALVAEEVPRGRAASLARRTSAGGRRAHPCGGSRRRRVPAARRRSLNTRASSGAIRPP